MALGEENTDDNTASFELGLPDMLIMKSLPGVYSDPVNGSSAGANPKRIPGAVVNYVIQVSNQGRGRASNLSVKDTLPASLLLATDSGGAGGDPISFSAGSSGLSYSYSAAPLVTSGGSPTDSDMDGCSDNVTGIEIEPVGDMAGEAPPATSFTFSYRTCLQ